MTNKIRNNRMKKQKYKLISKDKDIMDCVIYTNLSEKELRKIVLDGVKIIK